MKKNRVVVLGPNHPVPTRSLWFLLKHVPAHRDVWGIPATGHEKLSRAYQTVSEWLYAVETELQLPSFGEDEEAVEIDPKQLRLGVCPECNENDGSLEIAGTVFGLCHRHRVRWAIDPEFVDPTFYFSVRDESAEKPEGPYEHYAVIEPVTVEEENREDYSRAGAVAAFRFGEAGNSVGGEEFQPADERGLLARAFFSVVVLLLAPAFWLAEKYEDLVGRACDYVDERVGRA